LPVEERAEEEESECNYVGGEIAVFVELLCGAIATNMQAKEEEEEEEVVVVEGRAALQTLHKPRLRRFE
jgi:uncharacterized NAD-dependent epimerase/dehydratase family protein